MYKPIVPVFSALILTVDVQVRSCSPGPVDAAATDVLHLPLQLNTLDAPHFKPHLSWPGILYGFWLIQLLSSAGTTSFTVVPMIPFKTQDWFLIFICSEKRTASRWVHSCLHLHLMLWWSSFTVDFATTTIAKDRSCLTSTNYIILSNMLTSICSVVGTF